MSATTSQKKDPIKKIIRNDLAQKIRTYFQSKKYVIKPINSSRSNGIIIVEKENLDEVLQRILLPEENELEVNNNLLRRYRPKKPLIFEYWKGDKNSVFLVEEFIESELVRVNDNLYDPTYRMACVMSCVNGKIDITCLEGFCKIPRLSIQDEGPLTDKHVSKHRSDLSSLPAEQLKISPEQMSTLAEGFKVIFSRIYRKILKYNP